MLSLDAAFQEGLFITTLDQLDLLPAWQYVLTHNPAKDAPFHHNYRTLHVTRIAHQLLGHYNNPHERVLVLAGLFHSFNHGGGTCGAEDNTARALAGFNAFLQADCLPAGSIPVPAQVSIRQVIKLMNPVESHKATGAVSKCLVDAQHLYLLANNSVEALMEGLRHELSQPLERPLTYSLFLDLYLPSLKVTALHTPTGQAIWNALAPELYNRLTQYATDHVEPATA